ncbi:hypothetical protein [Pseudonocardia spinosispora]|uniref:hypothetical protein n=1 Tax=Pseudonocardia spinosispora TaxID=103441 RepID=UPI00040F76A1|nr:hypothetical protein [Pseudonocardia spinosispora]
MGNELLGKVLDAHGGLERWRELTTIRASIVSGGDLWGIKGLVQDSDPREMTVRLHEQWASVQPYGAPDQRTDFTADRIAIEKLDGRVVAERRAPRESFAGHTLATPWDALHRAYFNGYALWTYLTAPFLLAMPGFTVTEIEPVTDHGERWLGLSARYPAHIAGHSTVQEFYFGEHDHLLRRNDYRVDVAGGFIGVHYVSDLIDAGGILVPTTRRAYRRESPDGPVLDQLMVSIDLSDIRVS